MHAALALAALCLAPAAQDPPAAERTFDLATRYVADEGVVVRAKTDLWLDPSEILNGGESRRGATWTLQREHTRDVRWLSVEDGRPTRARHRFLAASAEEEASWGARSLSVVHEPRAAVTVLEVKAWDGRLDVRFVDGPSPEVPLREIPGPAFAIDALLPNGPVAVGDAWTVDGPALRTALLGELREPAFPHEHVDAKELSRTCAFLPFGRLAPIDLVRRCSASAEAELASVDEARKRAVIRFDVEMEGSLPRLDRAERGGWPHPEGFPDDRFELEAKGRLVLDLERGLPRALHLAGTFTVEGTRRDPIADQGEHGCEQPGRFEHVVTYEPLPAVTDESLPEGR